MSAGVFLSTVLYDSQGDFPCARVFDEQRSDFVSLFHCFGLHLFMARHAMRKQVKMVAGQMMISTTSRMFILTLYTSCSVCQVGRDNNVPYIDNARTHVREGSVFHLSPLKLWPIPSRCFSRFRCTRARKPPRGSRDDTCGSRFARSAAHGSGSEMW